MKPRVWVALLVGLSVLGGAASVRAERPSRQLSNFAGASVNSLGLVNSLDLSWRWSLFESSSPLLRDAHFTLAISNSLSFRYGRLGGWVALAPLSPLEVRAGVEPVAYWGLGDTLLPFPSYDADFSSEARKSRTAESVAGTGVRLFLSPTLRFRLGRVVGTATFDLEHWRVGAPGLFFYEPSRDTLLADESDSLVRSTSFLLWEVRGAPSRGLRVGVFHGFQRVNDAPRNDIHRIGPAIQWELGSRRLGLRQPDVIAAAYYYLDDPSKRHEIGAFAALRFVISSSGGRRPPR